MKSIPHYVEAWNPSAAQWQVWERFPSRNVARENGAGIRETLRPELQIVPALTQVVSSHRSQSLPFNKRGFPRTKESRPQPQNPLAYFFHDQEGVLNEIKHLGIQFCAWDVTGDTWPALVLPSGKVLASASAPEGNGPWAIHAFDQE